MFSWTVVNIGEGKTLKTSWTDSISIQAPSIPSTVTLLQKIIKIGSRLARMEKYSVNTSTVLPYTVYGELAIKLISDVYSFTGDTEMSNNVNIVSPVDIKLRAIDLKVTSFIINNAIQAGNNLSVTYTVQNVGAENASQLIWKDRIFISESFFGDPITSEIEAMQ